MSRQIPIRDIAQVEQHVLVLEYSRGVHLRQGMPHLTQKRRRYDYENGEASEGVAVPTESQHQRALNLHSPSQCPSIIVDLQQDRLSHSIQQFRAWCNVKGRLQAGLDEGLALL